MTVRDEYVLVVPGKPVPWAPKQSNPKGGGGRFVAAPQAKHAGKIIDAWERTAYLKGLWWEKGVPLTMSADFYLCRPKNHYGTGANARKLKTGFYVGAAPGYPTGKPDTSNLVKMVEDALTGVAWADDDQFVALHPAKHYVHWWEPARSVIRITPL